MKVAILGCGPAGLMAAQAVSDVHQHLGEDLTMAIFSRKVKSPLYGAQYLHKPIPGVTPSQPSHVSYQLRGEADDYRRKVYGQMWSGTVSPEDLMSSHEAWDIRATYDMLWSLYHDMITDTNVDPVFVANLVNGDCDLIINTIPRPTLCHAGHPFGAIEIVAAGDAPVLGIRVPFQCPDQMVICNGLENPSWYRMCRVFGHTTVEWPPYVSMVPVSTAAKVKKPLRHDCTCWPELLHVGRYGAWEKGVLSHTAYFETYKKIDQMMGVESAAREAGA